MSAEENTTHPGGGVFATTRWSLVLAAGQPQAPAAQEALETLCRTYWYPLYVYVRRQGHGTHEAQDLTQAFFARLLERNDLADADEAKGKFRTFLLTRLKHFLADEWDKAKAQKRGGGVVHLPIDGGFAETWYGSEPVDPAAPDKTFERRWALTLLEQVYARLRGEYAASGKAKLFDQLKSCLAGEKNALPYAALGAQLGTSEGAVKVAVHRLRQRYRELLRAEIAHTVASAAEIDEELRYLTAVLSGS